jgi:hypothetical protein
MKKLFLLMLILGLATFASANYNRGSTLNLVMFDNSNMVVTFDDQLYDATRNFVLTDVRPGRHIMKVVKRGDRQMRGRTVFHGTIDIDPASEIFAEIDQMNRLHVVDSYPMDRFAQRTTYDGYRDRGRHQGNRRGDYRSQRWNQGYGNRHQGHRHTTHHRQHQPDPAWWSPACRFNHLHAMDFRSLKRTINGQWFDSTKAQIARDAIRRNHISAHQLRDILMLMDFERTRVDLAKFAYRHTCDTERFFVVYDAFQFDRSVRELTRFTAHRY